MNEVEFVTLSRTFRTGATVLFSDREAATEPPRFDRELALSTGAGFVLKFVDPAKPALVYRTAGGETSVTTGVEFFQDALYAADPGVPAKSFSLWTVRSVDQRQNVDPWIGYLQEIVGRPLSGDTALFDAYAEGVMGKTFPEPSFAGGALSEWVRHHVALLGTTLDALSCAGFHLVWDGHDVYTFT